jgi:hypothetical protein
MPNFIYEIPTVWLAIYCSLFFVGLTWFGVIFIKPFLRLMIGREPHVNDLVAQATAGFSLFYGLLLGLLAVAAYQNFDEVRRSAFAEAATLASLYRDAANYPNPERSEIQELLRDYTLYVIYKDWPAHRKGLIYKGGSNRLTMIQHSILKFNPQTASQELLHGQTLEDFNNFVAARQNRLAGVRTQLPGVLWYAVVIGALINLLLIWVFNMRFFTHLLLGTIVSFFLGVMIFLVASLDSPMRGEVSVSSDNYQLVYDVVMVWDEVGVDPDGGI